MPVITRKNDERRYNELLNARRTSVIEAAKIVYETKLWIANKEQEWEPNSKLQYDMEQKVAEGISVDLSDERIVKQHQNRIQKLNNFKRMLAKFEEEIRAYNTLSQPVELSWNSGMDCYYPRTLVSFSNSLSNKFLADWYHEQGCNVSGIEFYDSLRNESEMARSSIYYPGVLARVGIVLGCFLAIGGELLGMFVNPAFFVLMIVGVVLASYSSVASDKHRQYPVADNYIEHEAPVVSDRELAHILKTGQAEITSSLVSRSIFGVDVEPVNDGVIPEVMSNT
ncbi:MAG: hypothetical protein P1U36_08915 [Legionellaceae bacterium]|nr:hypothetical protein [Legionellaceae bacterium]